MSNRKEAFYFTRVLCFFQNKRIGTKSGLLQKGKNYDQMSNAVALSEKTAGSFTFNKRKEYYGSTSKLQHDTYESVCDIEDTEERNQMAQKNFKAMMEATGANSNNKSSQNNTRVLKRVLSAPVGIEMPKG